MSLSLHAKDGWHYPDRYQSEVAEQEFIESNLTENMIECINNEIVLRSIPNRTSLFQVLIGFHFVHSSLYVVVTRNILLYSSSQTTHSLSH